MKLKNKALLGAMAVALTGTAVAILPMATSSAAEACATPWNASQVYTNGNKASYQGKNWTAQWWTQNEVPTSSGEWGVWRNAVACGGGTTEPTTPPVTTQPTTPPTTPPTSEPPVTGRKMPAAPYIYPGWGNPPAPATVMNATGIKAFTIAFVLASNGCNPAWDGSSGLTGGAHASTIAAIRAAGGDVVPSIGGWSGNKLGPNCSTPEALAGAYQKVIDTFGLKAIDIDIENTDEFENYVVADRILDALKIVKQKNPGVTTILTFGTTPTGPNQHGIRLIQQAKAKDARIDVWSQMPFDFNVGNGDMHAATVGATEGLKAQLKSTFGWSDAEAYSRMGISGMNGLSDQFETTSPATWTKIRDYAKDKNLARFTYWAVNRDRPCPGGGVVSDCSGIAQGEWEFTRITAGF